MGLEVNILGCGSASPSLRHLPSCQVVNYNGNLFMVDCGEGAQLGMRRMGLSFSRLRHIFISHLHGDHVLGLPGLLSTLALCETHGEVHVYMPAEGVELMRMMIAQFAHSLTYNLEIHPLKIGKALIYEDKSLTVETMALCHTVPAVGFIFREKPKPRRMRGDMLEFYKVPVNQRAAIKAGADFVTDDGRVIPNSWLTSDPLPSASYAYCSDTVYNPGVVQAVAGVGTLYHEATYADDKAHNAAQRGHSTARQAGQAAREAGAKQLIIGHFSNSYAGKEDILRVQAEEAYGAPVLVADEGKTIQLSLAKVEV